MTNPKISYEREHKGDTMDNELTSVLGIVVPVDWDDNGVPLATAILGPNKNEYYVEQDERGAELLAVVTRVVEVKGVIKKAGQGQKVIKVESYDLKIGDEQCIIE